MHHQQKKQKATKGIKSRRGHFPLLTQPLLHFYFSALITCPDEVMSQSGKVLHLYVEVRSASDQTGGKEVFEDNGKDIESVKESPAKILSQLATQTSCQAVTKSPPGHHLVQDCTHSQTKNHQARSSSRVGKKTSPCDGLSALHSNPTTHASGNVSIPHTPPICQKSKETDVNNRQRSVVTFSYVEKSNVKTVESPLRSVYVRGSREERSTPSHLRKRLSDPVWFGSPDSSCSSSPKLTFQSPERHQQTFSPSFCQPHLDPIGRAATQRAVEEFGSPLLRIKLAHALAQASCSHYNQQPRCHSWAGSPVQRQNISVTPTDNLTSKSQVTCGFPRSPASDTLSSQSRQSSLLKQGSCLKTDSVQQSPEQRMVSRSPPTKRYIHRACNKNPSPQGVVLQHSNNVVKGLNQLSNSKSTSPAQSPEVARRLAEEATKASSVLTQSRRSLLHNPLDEPASSSVCGDLHTSPSNAQQSKQVLKMNIPLNDQHMPATDKTVPHQPGSSIFKSDPHKTNHHANHSTQRELCMRNGQQKNSFFPEAQNSPALPSRVFRPTHPPTDIGSPLRDPRLHQAELRAPDTPTLHRHQQPQYTGDSWSTCPDRREDLSCFEKGDCTEFARRLLLNQCVEEAPLSWTSRQQWENHVSHNTHSNPESVCTSKDDRPPDHHTTQRRRPLSPSAQQKRAEQRRRELLLLGPVALDSPEEDEGCEEEGDGNNEEGYELRQQPHGQRIEQPPEAEQNEAIGGSSSRSSSGVTGSLGDRECLSPESSQSSRQSNETGAATSGIQVSTVEGPKSKRKTYYMAMVIL